MPTNGVVGSRACGSRSRAITRMTHATEQIDDPFTPYDVTCARCGKVLPCDEAYVEEGNEWECPECWERCEAAERAALSAEGGTT